MGADTTYFLLLNPRGEAMDSVFESWVMFGDINFCPPGRKSEILLAPLMALPVWTTDWGNPSSAVISPKVTADNFKPIPAEFPRILIHRR